LRVADFFFPLITARSTLGALCAAATISQIADTSHHRANNGLGSRMISISRLQVLADGLTEAASKNEEEFGLERVKQQVTKHSEER
jgi:hypothetical protein